jgi:SprT protein
MIFSKMNSIYRIFFILTLTSLILFILVFFNDLKFRGNPLSKDVIKKLEQKERQITSLIYKNYHFKIKFPIIIEDQLPNNLFGLATYKKGVIKIYLNKKRFQENENYMIEYVLPHEYAHALMFYTKDFTKENGGHTKKWQEFCYNIGGKKCNRFVDHNDILIEKLGGIY